MLRLNMRDLLGETPARQSSGTHPSQKICSKAIWCRADKRKEIPNRLINNADNLEGSMLPNVHIGDKEI